MYVISEETDQTLYIEDFCLCCRLTECEIIEQVDQEIHRGCLLRLLLKEVAGVMGTTSVEAFRSRCPTVWGDIGRAEQALRRRGGNDGQPLEWIGMLEEPAAKLQGVWGRELSKARRDSVLR